MDNGLCSIPFDTLYLHAGIHVAIVTIECWTCCLYGGVLAISGLCPSPVHKQASSRIYGLIPIPRDSYGLFSSSHNCISSTGKRNLVLSSFVCELARVVEGVSGKCEWCDVCWLLCSRVVSLFMLNPLWSIQFSIFFLLSSLSLSSVIDTLLLVTQRFLRWYPFVRIPWFSPKTWIASGYCWCWFWASLSSATWVYSSGHYECRHSLSRQGRYG